MIIGGYTLKDDGVHGITVSEYEAGWSFFLQGDDAEVFRCEWKVWQLKRDNNFAEFLNAHEYDTLFHQAYRDSGDPHFGDPESMEVWDA